MSDTDVKKAPFNWGRFFEGASVFIGVIIAISVICTFVFWAVAVTFVDNYELGYTYDLRTGKIEKLARTGYIVRWPVIVKVHTIDLRPMQVCINANKRVLNCKLVQFNPAGVDTFISWHGRSNYDGTDVGTGGLNDILKSYAYDGSGKSYPFLTIIRELKPDELSQAKIEVPK